MRRPGVRIPLPPAFAWSAAKSEGCHAGAFGEGGRSCQQPFERSKTTAWQASLLRSRSRGRLSRLMNGFYYVYILVSETNPELHYTGRTRNLAARLSKHNQDVCVQTSKNRPWKIETALAFRSEAKARRFEHYLKTGSGREFARRHF